MPLGYCGTDQVCVDVLGFLRQANLQDMRSQTWYKCWQKADVGLTQETQFTGYAIALTPKLP
ncbi:MULTISPECIES: hypothetical protein [Cyanophyceae]|uniref:hypothetical protein n=1 Tax=Cyanophyceae TaxID=3028117 RepID=UPI001688CCCE|nr:hypothetical protein [Trichocoleus sp. FACHB-69]MBD1934673.1 hypothetical protein [Trichocoleus sp. FACHB-69]